MHLSKGLGPYFEEDQQLAAYVRPIHSNFRLFQPDKKTRAFERRRTVSR
jgi:hypothetical protein